jgi:vanadium nitrogenase delta subunit
MMDARAEELFEYVQERCLWQFHSRSWDRRENIEGVITKTIELLEGKTPDTTEPKDRCFVADARILVVDFRSRFPWIKEAGAEEIRSLMDQLCHLLIEATIINSKNRELEHNLY